LPPDLERQDRPGVSLGRGRRVGELDAAGLHAAAGQHLRFEDDRDGEVAGDLRGLGGGACDAAPEERRAVAGEEGLRFVLVEPHWPDAEREAANTLRRQGSRDGPRDCPRDGGPAAQGGRDARSLGRRKPVCVAYSRYVPPCRVRAPSSSRARQTVSETQTTANTMTIGQRAPIRIPANRRMEPRYIG